jgi:carbamoyl-phosphate synthase small subunit
LKVKTNSVHLKKDNLKKINPTGILVLEDGSFFQGFGFGFEGITTGEVCFNTSITGYQEIITDPSYAGQIINFTFPHIGNVGTNIEDNESNDIWTRGVIFNTDITTPSNYRSMKHLDAWLKKNKIIGIAGIDTRKLTNYIRDNGAPKGSMQFSKKGKHNIESLQKLNRNWPGLLGLDLASQVSCKKPYKWNSLKTWNKEKGYKKNKNKKYKIVAIDYGIKKNILRCLTDLDCEIKIVPAKTSSNNILAENPDGIILSNGPGDPAATGKYAIPTLKKLINSNLPIFGICLGHQLLALALGAKTSKMHMGHRGANHPVKNLKSKKVEITSQNHGFKVEENSIPNNVEITHLSLFDRSVEGIELKNKPVFSVQYHPEANPGPQDSKYLFEKFINNIVKRKKYA